MAALSAFTKYIRPSFAACPEAILLEAVLRACIDYARRTRFLTEIVTVTTAASTRSYAIPVSSSVEPIELHNVRRGSSFVLEPLDAIKVTQIRYDIWSGTPRAYYMDEAKQIELYPLPTAVEDLKVTVAVMPKDGATTISDNFLAGERKMAIVDGAKAWLQLMDNTPWYDPQKASINQAKFDEAISKETYARAKGRSRMPTRTRAYHF
jgi:hypothetical protein